MLKDLGSVGTAGRAALEEVRRHRRGDCLLRGVARQARLARVRDRRRRDQAERSGAARETRIHLEVPALGDRVQVPGRAEGRDAAPHRDQHRPHRRRHAVRDARADRGRGLDDLDGDAAQPRRHHPQGHPPRRARDHREGRRRDSARRRPGRQGSRSADAALDDADRRVRSAAASCRRRKTRRCGAARTARARRSCAAGWSTSRRAAR